MTTIESLNNIKLSIKKIENDFKNFSKGNYVEYKNTSDENFKNLEDKFNLILNIRNNDMKNYYIAIEKMNKEISELKKQLKIQKVKIPAKKAKRSIRKIEKKKVKIIAKSKLNISKMNTSKVKISKNNRTLIERLQIGIKKALPWKVGMSKYPGIIFMKVNNKWKFQSGIFNKQIDFNTKEDVENYYENLLKKYNIDFKTMYRRGYVENPVTEQEEEIVEDEIVEDEMVEEEVTEEEEVM